MNIYSVQQRMNQTPSAGQTKVNGVGSEESMESPAEKARELASNSEELTPSSLQSWQGNAVDEMA